ncbi:MAG TPA: GxxExxY protein [Cyclobacteriaceae bacterium]|nr:GxxExxY protein [Cyclobacteriaceae bacterium]HRE65870.1 GxxExxY protein [Cyclobacteriaceae bacterium]HRF33714.1 GxxExxY protein [Cyclobacteriaceae bacterium]
MTEFDKKKYPYQEKTYLLNGIAMEVHRILGRGFLEIVYKDALEYEFKNRKIKYEREKEYLIAYKDTILPHKFYADFVVFDKIILEVKAQEGIVEEHYSQVINYLAVSKCKIGLIYNFGSPSLEIKRVIL